MTIKGRISSKYLMIKVYINSLVLKENRGGFFEEIDVDLLVSSMKGATMMNPIQEEKYEYDKFVIGFA